MSAPLETNNAKFLSLCGKLHKVTTWSLHADVIGGLVRYAIMFHTPSVS